MGKGRIAQGLRSVLSHPFARRKRMDGAQNRYKFTGSETSLAGWQILNEQRSSFRLPLRRQELFKLRIAAQPGKVTVFGFSYSR